MSESLELRNLLGERKALDAKIAKLGGPERVVTVRMPALLHGRLTDAAHVGKTSINQFCIDAITDAIKRTVEHGRKEAAKAIKAATLRERYAASAGRDTA